MNVESLQSRRTWMIGGAVAALLMVVASWYLVISPKVSNTASIRSETADNDLANSRLIAKRGQLVREQRDIVTLRAKLSAALAALPATSALPEFTHEVTQAAGSSAVTLKNITFGSLSAVTSASATSAPTTSTSASDTSASTSATASTSTTASTSATAAQYQVDVTLTTGGSIEHQLTFIRAIENGSRRALFTSTSVSGSGTSLALTSQLNIFTAPMTVAQVAHLRTLLAG